MPMDWDGKVGAPRLVCVASGAAIEPGATFFSALLFQDGAFLRRDFAEAAWETVARDGFLSWWRQRAPKNDDTKARPVDIAALLGMFHALKEETDRPKVCFGYVILLFLLRARKLRFKEIRHEAGGDFLLVEDRANRCLYKVRDPNMSIEEQRAVQENLQRVIDVGVAAPEE